MSTYLYHEIKTETCGDEFFSGIVFDIFEYQRACFVLKWTASNSYLGYDICRFHVDALHR